MFKGRNWARTLSFRPQWLAGRSCTKARGLASLYTIDPNDGTATLLGPTGFNRVSAIDFDPSGTTLYGVGSDANGVVTLITIDPMTGLGTAVGPANIGSASSNFQDISFHSNGILFGYVGRDAGGAIYTLDLGIGTATLVGFTGQNFAGGDALAFDQGNILYNINGSESEPSNIDIIDTGNGAATNAGQATYPSAFLDPRINAMDYDLTTGTLYASVVHGNGPLTFNFLATIDITTGIVSDIGSTVQGLDGLTVRPAQGNHFAVPDSTSTLWLALPLAGMFLVSRLPRVRV